MNIEQAPCVSILMTSYNRAAFISEAIESVVLSSFQDWELIIVDDGSTDETVQIASKYAEKDSRIRFYKNENNIGDYPNRNKAASYARGKYLKYVDADDLMYSFGLEVMVEAMERFPNAVYGLNGISQDESGIYPRLLNSSEAYFSDYNVASGLLSLPPTCSIIRRDIFEKVKGFEPLKMVGDVVMWHKLSSEYSMVVLPYGLTWCRAGHADSESGRWMKQLETTYGYLKVRRRFLEDASCPLVEENRKFHLKKIIRSQFKIILKMLKSFDVKVISRIAHSEHITFSAFIKAQFNFH